MRGPGSALLRLARHLCLHGVHCLPRPRLRERAGKPTLLVVFVVIGLFTFSSATAPDGAKANNVVWFGSANQTYASGKRLSNNTVTIYGDAGLGKTHLLPAIAHYVNETDPTFTVRYVTTETFLKPRPKPRSRAPNMILEPL